MTDGEPRPLIYNREALLAQIDRLSQMTPHKVALYRCRLCRDASWVEVTADNVDRFVKFPDPSLALDEYDRIRAHEEYERMLDVAKAAVGAWVPCPECNAKVYDRWKSGDIFKTGPSKGGGHDEAKPA